MGIFLVLPGIAAFHRSTPAHGAARTRAANADARTDLTPEALAELLLEGV